MKICNSCKINKSKEEFAKNRAKKDGLQGLCKICKRAYDRQFYKDSPTHKIKIRVLHKEQVEKLQIFIMNYLKIHPCVDCGESDILVLDFDHSNNKSGNISRMIHNAVSIATMEKEISKCDVRCANCHRRKTAKQFNYYKYNASIL